VASHQEAGRYALPETTSFQSSPLVAGEVLYVTTPTSTYAIDATNGKLIWTQKYEPKSMGLGTGIRGTVYEDERL